MRRTILPARAAQTSHYVAGLTLATALAAPAFGKTAAKALVRPTPSTAIATVISAPATSVTTTILRNGATLVVRRDTLAPRVGLSILVRVGAADETIESAGWRRVLADAMLHATLTGSAAPAADGKTATSGEAIHTPAERARLAEQWNARLGINVGDDVMEFWAVGDSAGTLPLLDELLDMALRPRLSDDDIEHARQRLQARQQAEDEIVAVHASNALVGQIYRDASGNPMAYGLPGNGTAQSLTDLGANRIRGYFKYYFKPSRLVVGAVGDVDGVAVAAHLKERGQASKPTGPTTNPLFAPLDNSQPPLIVRQMRTPSAWVFVAYQTAGMTSGDYPALRVLAACLTQSSQARLTQRLMGSSRRAHAADADTEVFQVAGQVTPRRFAGDLVIFAQTGPQNVENVKNAILDEVRKLGQAPLAAAELDAARDYASGNWAMEREALHDRAYQLALAQAVAAPADASLPQHIGNVTAADVQRVARKYLGHYVVALIMPQE